MGVLRSAIEENDKRWTQEIEKHVQDQHLLEQQRNDLQKRFDELQKQDAALKMKVQSLEEHCADQWRLQKSLIESLDLQNQECEKLREQLRAEEELRQL